MRPPTLRRLRSSSTRVIPSRADRHSDDVSRFSAGPGRVSREKRARGRKSARMRGSMWRYLLGFKCGSHGGPARRRVSEVAPFPVATGGQVGRPAGGKEATISHSLSKTMVARFAEVNGGHVGRPLWFGSPVRAKRIQASLTFAAKARAASPPPVAGSQRSVLSNTNGNSAQWYERMRPSRTGVFHANR